MSNQDKKHAFDLMHRQGGAELGLLRLSVPRRTVRINSKNDQKGRLRVWTAHGLAKGVVWESGGVVLLMGDLVLLMGDDLRTDEPKGRGRSWIVTIYEGTH